MRHSDYKEEFFMSANRHAPMPINSSEAALVASAFASARDFRTVGERITAPIDSIIDETARIIENDPIMNVSDELSRMNREMQAVYGTIIDNDGAFMKFIKGIPGVGALARKLDEALDDTSFNMQDINGKIGAIFSGFDQSYTSLNLSIDMQHRFVEGIEHNLEKVIAYKELLEEKLAEHTEQDDDMQEHRQLFLRSVEFFLTNLVVLVGNLEMAKKRLLIRLDSAQKLSLSMSASKPIFKTLLSTAVIEISGQKAIDASMEAMNAMSRSIDNMSATLTDKAIEGNQKAEEMTSKPLLSTTLFIENVTKLKNHFEAIEDYRQKVADEAHKERADFDAARQNLEAIKVLTREETNEIEAVLSH